jgi:hypothetical protein
MLRLRAIVEYDVGLTGNTVQDAARIRNYLYEHTVFEMPGPRLDWLSPAESYLALTREGQAVLCGDLALAYISSLEAVGIAARYVGMFSDNKTPYLSHASVEFWHAGRWLASDPTFNVMFWGDNRFLSYTDLARGAEYQVVTNGYPVLPGRMISDGRSICPDGDWDVPLAELLRFGVVHPARVWDNGVWHEYPARTWPEGWDGEIVGVGKVDRFGPPYNRLVVVR